jgi:hypothetical protein
MLRHAFAAVLSLWVACAVGPANLLPNPSFEDPAGPARTGWTLEGKGAWVSEGAHSGAHCLMVDGDGKTVNYWGSHDLKWQPSTLYQFSFWRRGDPGASGGCIISGPIFANDDWGWSADWEQVRYVFLTPPTLPTDAYLRVGGWMISGRIFYDDLSLVPATVLHSKFGDLELGEGETIDGADYTCQPNYAGFANNYSRSLADFNCGFNSNRWGFGPGSFLTYKHELPGVKMTKASVGVNVNYYTSGTGLIDVSTDGKSWRQIAKLSGLGGGEFTVPADMFPASAIYVRVSSPGEQEKRADSAPGAFQIDGYTFRAVLDRNLGTLVGQSTYITPEQESPDLAVAVKEIGTGSGEHTARMAITNNGPATANLRAELVVTMSGTDRKQTFPTEVKIAPGKTADVTIPWLVREPAEYELALRVLSAGKQVYLASAGGFAIPTIEDASFGYAIRSDAAADLWWCEGPWKVSRDRLAPTEKRPEMSVEAARDEFEPFQLVLRPKRPLTGLEVKVGDFSGAGSSLPASIVSVKQVEYVQIKIPTDNLGGKGWWPDPLPPVKGPLDAPAGRNLPLWLTVHVPRDARPGAYMSAVTLTADGGFRAQVPLRLRVFSFAIPEEVHVQTALGLGQGEIWRYHNLTGPDDAEAREKVWDLYMQDWRDHHIAPYSFWTKPFNVQISGFAWTGGEYDETTFHGGRQSLKIVDNNPSANPESSLDGFLPFEHGKTYTLRLWAKTATDGQGFGVTLGQFDGGGAWMSGRNIDLVLQGSAQWRQYDIALPPDRFDDRTAKLSFCLRPVPWMENGSTTGTTWFDDVYLGLAPEGPNLLKDTGFEASPDAIKVTIDWTEWDKQAEKYLNGYHFTTFALPIMGLGWGRNPSYSEGALGPFKFGTPEYEKLMGDYLMQLQSHLEAKGWLNKQFLYWFDEPETTDYPFVIKYNALIHKLAPKLNRMLTEEMQDPLIGAVDSWCPVLCNYNPQRAQARQKAGDRVWWYICCGPKAPYLGEFIDHPHSDMRAWPWATWKWRVQGCLIWTTTWWTCSGLFGDKYQNPWDDPESYCDGAKPGAISVWGNGDGRFLYPPNRKGCADQMTKYVEGPVDSYRWDCFRDGLDDYEYLWMLRDAIEKKKGTAAAREAAAKLLVVPDTIVGPETWRFNHKPTALLEWRHNVAEALEKLR